MLPALMSSKMQILVSGGAAVVVLASSLYLLYLFYICLLPKPIPGIPYNREAAKRILGDLADIFATSEGSGRRLKECITSLTRKHNSPIAQLFFGPFSSRIVVISDFRETRDILLRRNKEFGKGKLNIDGVRGVFKESRSGMETHDPRFKEITSLSRDLMSPNFLNMVSAPRIFEKVAQFVEFWNLKTRISGGRPFSAENDIHVLTSGTITAVALGLDDKDCGIIQNIDHLSSVQQQVVEQNGGKKETAGQTPFEFPNLPLSEQLWALHFLLDVVHKSLMSPSPKLYHMFNNFRPTMRKALSLKNQLLKTQIARAAERFSEPSGIHAPEPRTALESMIQREIAASKKAGRPSKIHSEQMEEELYGYIVAGHDVTHAVVSYMTKYLAEYQKEQKTVRAALYDALMQAHKSGRQPRVDEIINTKIPALDAYVKEVIRICTPTRFIGKEAAVDTVILGHHIPKGTMCFIQLHGPTYTEPGIPVNDACRSDTSRKHTDIPADWADTPFPPEKFMPERWLRRRSDGEVVFDPHAGPFGSFSAGPRECFGKRLAYLELRIITALLVWNFEFLPLPPQLHSWEENEALLTKPTITYVRLRKVL